MHPRPLLLCLGLLALFAAPTQARDESTTRCFVGSLGAGGQGLRLEIDVTSATDGSLSGELRSLDQGNVGVALTELRLDEQTLSFDVPEIGGHFDGRRPAGSETYEGTWKQGAAQLPLSLAPGRSQARELDGATLREAWVGELDAGPMRPVLQFRVYDLPDGGTGARFDSVTEGRTDFPADWTIEDGELRFHVPAVKATFVGALDSSLDRAVGSFAQGGRDMPITLTRQADVYDDVNTWDKRPQRPVEPLPYRSLEVRFENSTAGLTLAGTLTVPEGPGPFPAVALITGSGQQDRDETLMGHKPFLVLADQLTRRGFAVLRYDDRGTARSTGTYAGVTIKAFAGDASAAVDFLMEHELVDPERVGLIGHSEGGLVAPLVAAARDDLALIVLLAGPIVTGVETLRSQGRAIAAAEGASVQDIAFGSAVREIMLTEMRRDAPIEEVHGAILAGFDSLAAGAPEARRDELETERGMLEMLLQTLDPVWFRFFLDYDPAPTLAAVRCPVLGLFAGKDVQVLASTNRDPMAALLAEHGHPDSQVVELPGLNHLFQTAETGAMSEYLQIAETFAPAALDLIAEWMAARVGLDAGPVR